MSNTELSVSDKIKKVKQELKALEKLQKIDDLKMIVNKIYIELTDKNKLSSAEIKLVVNGIKDKISQTSK